MAPSAPTKGDEIPVEGKENMKAEVRKCKEEEKIKLEQREEKEESDGKKKEEESEEQSLSSSSPRGVLEIPISGSDDSDNSSNISCERSSSFGSYSDEKTTTIVVEKGGGGIISRESYAMQWKSLVDTIKKSSAKRLAIFGGGNDVSKRGLRKRLGRNHSAEEGSLYVEDFVVPKPSWRNFSYEELSQATHNFSPDKLIGKGGHAEVYKGCLSDGQIVAVKKITKQEKNDEDRVGDFLSELGIIAHINHPHAAKLIGFSSESDLHLVLDFLPHGSLASLLHGSNESLEWKLRHKVAVGVAEGLQYLHCDCQRRIIHRDITATNILLTEDYEPQISDFGLAKWLPEKWIHHVVSPIEGTFGYMAPEYFMHGILNEKTDVFAFGVLLLELITGRHAVDSSGQSLVIWAKPLLEKNNIKEIVDPRLGHNYDVIEMKRAIYTAETCIHHLPNMRPNMKRVIQLLKGEKDLLDMKQKSMGERALLLDACDLDEYSSTTYLKDLNRHMELVME